jgi:hypothetical protein
MRVCHQQCTDTDVIPKYTAVSKTIPFCLAGMHLLSEFESHFYKAKSFSSMCDGNFLQSDVFQCKENLFLHHLYTQPCNGLKFLLLAKLNDVTQN